MHVQYSLIVCSYFFFSPLTAGLLPHALHSITADPLSNYFIISLVPLFCTVCFSSLYLKTNKLISIWKTSKFPTTWLLMEIFYFPWKWWQKFSATQGKLSPFYSKFQCLVALQFGLPCILKVKRLWCPDGVFDQAFPILQPKWPAVTPFRSWTKTYFEWLTILFFFLRERECYLLLEIVWPPLIAKYCTNKPKYLIYSFELHPFC